MTLTELQRRVRQHIDVDLAPLYQQYRSAGGSDDINDFIRYLRDERVIDARILADLHSDDSVEATFLLATNHPEAVRVARGLQRAAGEDEDEDEEEPPRYDMLGLLGAGAMGEVHLAQDVLLRRKVAFKSIIPAMQQNEQVLSRFLGEMQITAQLDHPFIVPVYGLEVTPDGSVAYAMKLVKGKELADLLSETRKALEAGQSLDDDHILDARLDVFVKVCDAVAFAHRRGIVHRDLKPANIMLGQHGEVYVMDWGIARPMGAGGAAADAGLELYDADGDPLDTERTRMGQALGTPIYMSPEQAAGRNAELDGRSDLYTLGLILQELITLDRAVGGTTLTEVMTNAKLGKREAPRPLDLAGRIPRELEAIIAKATRLKPDERYATVSDFAHDLRRYLRNEETAALPDGGLQRVGRWISRHRMEALSLMLAFLLTGAAAAIGLLIYNQARETARHTRELRLSEFQTESSIQAHSVDKLLQRYESGLAQLVGAAQMALNHPSQEAGRPYLEEDYLAGAGPADLLASSYYKKPISTEAPVFFLAPGSDRQTSAGTLSALSQLGPVLSEVMLDSVGVHSHELQPAQQRALIATTGVPVHRVFVTLSDGLHLAFPGTAGFPKGFKPAEHPAYQLAAGKPGIRWGQPALDASLGAMVMTCSASLYDESNQLRGVAGFEINIDRLGEEVDVDLGYVELAMLVARDGTVMATSGRDTSAVKVGEGLAIAEVTEAMKDGKAGHADVVFRGKQVVVTYYPLHTVEWYFVAVAPVGPMMESVDEAAPTAPWAGRAPKTLPTPTAAPTPRATATEEPDAGDEDAGAGGGDAGAPEDAGVAPAPESTGKLPWPTAKSSGAPPEPPEPPPAPPPDAKSAIPKNPFDKWDVYKGGQPKPPPAPTNTPTP